MHVDNGGKDDQESGSHVSELLKNRFWNDIPGTAAAEYTGLGVMQCDHQ